MVSATRGYLPGLLALVASAGCARAPVPRGDATPIPGCQCRFVARGGQGNLTGDTVA